MTTEIYLSSAEVSSTLPVLERILNGVATQRTRTQYVGGERPFEIPVYRDRRFDEEMFRYILSCRNKLKRIGSSRKLRLNCFEVAALALAARATSKGTHRGSGVFQLVPHLPRKLEKQRKRAKRAWIRRHGKDAFGSASNRWQRFVEWLRFGILAPQRRREPTRAATAIHREQREFMRTLACSMAAGAEHTKELERLADLAKAEVRRGRHPFTMRELLRDKVKAQKFLAEFILNRRNPGVLKTEFLPQVLRTSRLAKQFAAALTVNAPDSKLQNVLANWIDQEIDPGYFNDVRDEITFQLLRCESQHRVPVHANAVEQVIAACRPVYTADADLRSFFGTWAARFLLALQPHRDSALRVVSPAFEEAKSWSQKYPPLTRQRKLNEFAARYLR